MTLRSAIQELMALGTGGTVDFDPALFGPSTQWIDVLSPMPIVTRQLNIEGPTNGSLGIWITSEAGTFLVFQNVVATSEISSLQIHNASTGAVRLLGSDVTFRSCRFADNQTVNQGGVLFLHNGSTAGLIDCEVGPGNSAIAGGAIYLVTGTGNSFHAFNTLFRGNHATSGDGGAIFSGAGSGLALLNCTFDGNSASADAGAVYVGGSVAASTQLIANCTFTSNSASFGGAISRIHVASQFRMDNSVLANNTASQLGPNLFGNGGIESQFNFVTNGEHMTTPVHGVNNNMVGTPGAPLDARLGLLTNNGGPTMTRHPELDSPLVNASTHDPVFVSTDARGVPRRLGSAFDIGAVEAIRVNSLGDDNDGQYGAGQFTLREAINVAVARARIQFEPELTAGGAQEILLTSQLPTISKPLTIEGPGRHLLTLRATAGRILHLLDCETATVSGLSMTGATNSAILNDHSQLELVNCHLYSNVGGLEGGAIDNDNGATLVLYSCEVGPGNMAQFGGAIDNDSGAASFVLARDSLIWGNSTTAQVAGAIFTGGDHTTWLFNCIVAGNTAVTTCGGLNKTSGTGHLLLINTTVTGNTSATGGRGIHSTAAANQIQMLNTVVAGNGAGDVPDFSGMTSPSASQHVFIGAISTDIGITHGADGNHVGTILDPLDPMLGALGEYGGPIKTIRPLPGSPLIDAGTPTINELMAIHSLNFDARGLNRLHGPAVDIGAVEIHPGDLSPLTVDFNGDGIINVADVTHLGNYVTGKVLELNGNGDVNGDGSIDQLDVEELADNIANHLY